MMTVALAALSAASIAPGPGMRLGPPLADGAAQILVLDHVGKVASRVACLRTQWINPDDAAARLIGSTEVAATVLALDGKLAEVEQLGPSKFECVIIPA